jgi:hypothetical protein
MADASMDIVSKVDKQEVDNALNQPPPRRSGNRYDFKGVGAAVELERREGPQDPGQHPRGRLPGGARCLRDQAGASVA